MADRSAIGWTDDTANTWWGCTKVSAACLNCYIPRTVPFRINGLTWDGDGGIGSSIPLVYRDGVMQKWMAKARPRRIFLNSLSDTFHEDVPLWRLAEVFAYMALTPRHHWQVLTKRDKRMRLILTDPQFWILVGRAARRIATEVLALPNRPAAFSETLADGSSVWDGALWEKPRALANVWLGVTGEIQHLLDRRVGQLRRTPAAVRYVSVEPMQGEIFLADHLRADGDLPGLDWVITGGETGARADVRPIHPEWIRDVRDQCRAAGVAHYFKQWGSWAVEQREGDRWADRFPDGWIAEDGTIITADLAEMNERGPRHQGWHPVWYAGVSSKAAGNVLDGERIEEHPRCHPSALVAA